MCYYFECYTVPKTKPLAGDSGKKSIAAFNTIHRQEEPGFCRMAIICARGTKINAE